MKNESNASSLPIMCSHIMEETSFFQICQYVDIENHRNRLRGLDGLKSLYEIRALGRVMMKMLHQVLIACVIGGIMGILGHVKKRGRLEKPRMTKRFIYLGFLEDWFIGMTASILLVLSADPDSGIQLVILSIISGYGGEAVLRSFDFVREMNSGGEPAESKRQTKTPPE